MYLISYQDYVLCGGEMEATAFPPYQRRAGIMLDRLTFGHIQQENEQYGQYIGSQFIIFTEEELDALNYASTAIIDTLKELDDYKTQALSGNTSEANVKSRQSGGESITYESKKTAYDEALTSATAEMNLLKHNVFEVCDPYAFQYNPFYAGLESRWG